MPDANQKIESFKRSLIIGAIAFIFFILAYVFYHVLSKGVNQCSNPCEKPGLGYVIGFVLMPVAILKIILHFRPLRGIKNMHIKVAGLIFKIVLITFVCVMLFFLIVNFLERYSGMRICPRGCIVKVEPHPIAQWFFLLGNISLLILVHYFFQDCKGYEKNNPAAPPTPPKA